MTKVTVSDQNEVPLPGLRAFGCCQYQRPWMTLKGHYALCFKNIMCHGVAP